MSTTTTPTNSPSSDSDSRPDPNQNPKPDPKPNNSLSLINSSSPPVVCLSRFAIDSFGGAFTGAVFGYGSGFIMRKGHEASVAAAVTSAKTFAVLSGVHALVLCFLKKLRGKDDAINAGVAGCCTGLALSYPGTPLALLQSCVTLGALSYLMDGINQPKPALALPGPSHLRSRQLPQLPKLPVLPPLSIALPKELNDSFSSFCQSLKKQSLVVLIDCSPLL